jgi:hypothetical protein
VFRSGGDETVWSTAAAKCAPHNRAPGVAGSRLLSQGHTLAHVREVLGINRVTVYRWRQSDPSFAQSYSEAMETGTDLIEDEARRRGVEGYDRPVFQGGKMVGVVRVYSDMLAALLLRGRRPEIYRDTTSRGPSTPSIIIHGGLPTEDDDRR